MARSRKGRRARGAARGRPGASAHGAARGTGTGTASSGRRGDGRRARGGRSPEELVAMAVYAVVARPADLADLVDRLADRPGPGGGPDPVAAALADRLVRALGDRWEQGWQPADLVHVVGRRLRAPHRRVAAAAVVLDARAYRHGVDADPAWLAQVDAVAATWAGQGGGRGAAAGDPEAVDRLGPADLLGLDDPGTRGERAGAPGRGGDGGGGGGDRQDAIRTAVETIAEMVALPPQPRLCPPPSEWGGGPGRGASDPPPRTSRTGGSHRSGASRRAGGAGASGRARPGPGTGAPDPKITERVRALLAKAESTDFPEEAEAFTAKAQELIARHAIDLAVLEGRADGGAPRAHGRRVLIDDPYGTAKALLLGAIARANGCRAVRSKGLGICTVFGAPGDVDAVELLYTSLLTQATAAMVAAGRAGPRARSRGFRRSFLVAYADRIGERLQGATSAAVDDARARHGDDNVLPVLASREAAAEEACAEAFPRLRTERITTSDLQGWVAGRAAAELAQLGPTTAVRAG